MARFSSETPNGTAVQELEVLIRTALFKPAAAIVGCLLQGAADGIDAQYQSKPGEERKGRETLQVQCLFGTFALQRDYYHHPGKKSGHYPTDAALGLEGSYTPGLARLICLEGADESTYLKAERHLEQTGGTTVSARQIQRVVQRVGSAAQQWQQRPAQPGHCDAPMEHAGKVLEALIGKSHPDYKKRQRRWAKRLLKDKVEALIKETRQECASQPQEQAVEEALGYFVRNVSRMQYGTFRQANYFIGSGVVEAGCKTVIGGRCKQSGMFWSKSGAENILALRCIQSSRRISEFWKYRLDTQAARNDCLPFAA